MEDIEDLFAGGGGGAPPGFRLPVNSVGINPKTSKIKRISSKQDDITASNRDSLAPPSLKIPGTQTIYIKTFGCSHNQSDSEYMAGQLTAFGYALTEVPDDADLWLINTCTVKSPSQSAMSTLISRGRSGKKPLVIAGCVPQGSRDLKELEGISVVGVQQIDRVVEIVEETLKGHEVRLLNRKTLPALDLPKVRKNNFIEILPINVGCLGSCTYCKTKHARGHLGSYTVDSLVERVRTVISQGVKEIWLSSEDTGAYGRDIGVNLPILLNAIVKELPSDQSTMLRIGMTNPPFILEHLKEIAAILRHPCVYTFLHVPVQSGSDSVLTAMNREYTLSDFRTVVDTLTELVPGMQIATDIICGFPGETDEDFSQTVELIKDYKLSQVHISQFYPRPGTPAAKMKKVQSKIVKQRSRELTCVFEAFAPYTGMEGKVERIWITEIATDGVHLVGHTKGYIQVLISAPESMLGTSAMARITSVGRWSVFGEVIETLSSATTNVETQAREEKKTPSSSDSITCENCDCSAESCGEEKSGECKTGGVLIVERSQKFTFLEERNEQTDNTMTNLLALCLVLSTLLAAEVWSPSPPTSTHGTGSEGDVIVKDGHRVVVVEYDRDGKTNTRVSISPPSADQGDEEQKGNALFRNAKEKAKETASYLPNVGQGISQPVVTGEESRDHHATAGEVICDAFGKCRQKIASVVGKGKDRTAGTVGDVGETISDAVAEKAHDVKETVARAARDVEETVSDKAEHAKEKVTGKAYDVKESVVHKAQDAKEKVKEKAHEVKESVAHKAHESKEAAKDRVREKAHELKETAAHKYENEWDRVKTAARGFGSETVAALSPTKVGSVVGLTAIAAAYGTCVWVTFVSSYVLASVLGRQQFGVVQSKLYPVYFKAISVAILVGLFGHVLNRRKKLLTDAAEMWQGVNLLASFFMIEANKSFVEPRATKVNLHLPWLKFYI
ncbi:unnamed protein product [Arabis nemorensis]|uniref:Threonylcarbamoyladenosine tRNA methylthiotransferase n=1 Tax=Arabis nemorensis TaxID=586526 RepID=A0A565B058_9BRAS|nr:unnamed protein product [Arabis nemorensis]